MVGKRKKTVASYHYHDEDHNEVEDDYEDLGQQRQRQKMWSSSSGSSRRDKSSRSSTRRSSSGGVNKTSVLEMFESFTDSDDSTVISMEGISNLCDQLGIDVCSDIRIMVLLWRLGAGKEKPQQISKTEWCQGCMELQVESIAQLKALLPSLDPGFLERHEFKSFYSFCFKFSRQGKHTTLDKELVVDTLQLVLKGHVESERLDSFVEFLSESKDDSYKRITLDQWTSFLDFCYECKDLSDYDEATSAWPVLIDDYVDYMMEKNCK